MSLDANALDEVELAGAQVGQAHRGVGTGV
jgi:hypothetical protein